MIIKAVLLAALLARAVAPSCIVPLGGNLSQN
jgi:hypothetical protein